MPSPVLGTYRDAIDGLVIYMDGLPQEAGQKRARGAVQQAYRNLSLDFPWRYLTIEGRINVSAEYTTGTVSLVASTRTLTLSDGTWPSWARYGRLLIGTDTVVYKIAERSSDTVVTLETDFCPVDDLSGETFILYRSVYPLPGDLRSLERIHDEKGFWSTHYIPPDDWLRLERQVSRTGRPFYWTLMGAADLYGSLALCFDGRIQTAQTFAFIYQKTPRPLKYDGYEFWSSQGSGTLNSYSEGGVTANFLNVSLESDVVGTILRTAMRGASDPPGGSGSPERYAEQKVVTAWDGNLILTVGSGFEFARVSGEFTISDPVDLPAYMLEAFERGCELELAVRQTPDPDKIGVAKMLYKDARIRAQQRNNLVPPPAGLADDDDWTSAAGFLTGTVSGYWRGGAWST